MKLITGQLGESASKSSAELLKPGLELASSQKFRTGMSWPSPVPLFSPRRTMRQFAQPQTESAAFKDWFGKSKVVDVKTGKPLVVYRGEGSRAERNIYDLHRTRENGIFMTPDRDIASIYERGGPPREFYVKAERLLDLTQDTREAREFIVAWASWFGDWIDRRTGEDVDPVTVVQGGMLFDYEGDWSGERWLSLQAEALADHDAAYLPDWDNGVGMFKALVVKGGAQIKSATQNNGQFDPDNPDIRFSRQANTTSVGLGARQNAFRSWFGGSVVTDADGLPLRVFRGEHGTTEDGELQSLIGNYTFTGSALAASTYAMAPNNKAASSVALQPRVLPAYLSLRNPIINSPDDPFAELSDIEARLGRIFARSMAIKHEAHVQHTNNWAENFAPTFACVKDYLDQHPDGLKSLYLDAYALLDDYEFQQAAAAAGYDGAIHMGNGASASEVEYRIFSRNQAVSAFHVQPLIDADAERPDLDGASVTVTENGLIFKFADGIRALPRVREGDLATQMGGISPDEGAALTQIASVFGKRIHYFRDPGHQLGIAGFVRRGDQALIWLNVASDISPLAVFGHELVHLMSVDVPQAHAAIMRVVRQRIRAGDSKAFRRSYLPDDATRDEPLHDGDLAELTSDLGGNLLCDPSFWTDVLANVQRDHGSTAPGIFERLAGLLQGTIQRVLAVFKGDQFSVEQFVSDMDGVRQAFSTGFARYIRRQQDGAGEQQPAPGEPCTADAALFSLAGRKAIGADLQGLSAARQRIELAAAEPEQVRKDTGWYRDADQRWRFEISDDEARRTSEPLSTVYTIALQDVIRHPRLFQAYPALRDIPVQGVEGEEGEMRGSLVNNGEAILVNKNTSRQQQLSILIHEVQHVIQVIEGFAMGGCVRTADHHLDPKTVLRVQALTDQASEFSLSGRFEEARSMREEAHQIRTKAGFEQYRRLLGEVEARNVQTRLGMSAIQRQETSPLATADTSTGSVIIEFADDAADDDDAEAPADIAPQG